MRHEQPADAVRRTIQEVRRFHALGRKSLGKYPFPMPLKTRPVEAESRGLSPEILRRARRFADPERGYTERELDELFELCRKSESPLGLSHIYLLLNVPKAKRPGLQSQAVGQRWTRERLRLEIRRLLPRHSQGGRRPQQPASSADALQQIVDMCSRWRRWNEVLARPGGSYQLGPAIGRQMTAIDKRMGKLAQLAGRRCRPSGKGDGRRKEAARSRLRDPAV